MAPKQLGPYRLIKLLGSGRTAEVHCAVHKITKELVAIKLLHEFLTDQQMKQKFQAEAQIVQMLSHPGIVQILEADFYKQTRPYIVMTYAPGNSLRQRHPSGSTLSFQTILSYTKQIASALVYAHQKKIIHCDVKPENILVGKDGRLLLSDFGIARIRETTLSQTTRDAFGTATYMAPEQFRGKYSPATDQYALATMIYEWFCGSPPFSGDNYNQLMDRHMNMPVPSLQEACKEDRNIPPVVEHVLSQALAKNPKDRFSSVEEFVWTLEQALTSEGILNEPTPYDENTAFTIKRHFGTSRISSHQPQMSKVSFSRRTILGGLAGLTGLIAGLAGLTGLIRAVIVGTFPWKSGSTMDSLQIAANIAQVVALFWALLFGGKVIIDVIRGFRRRISIKVNPLELLNTLVATILVVLLGTLVRPILLPLPNVFSSHITSTPTPSPTTTVNTPSPTTTVNTNLQHFAYDFEDGTTQGWDTSEGQYKLATLEVLSDPVRAGNNVLQVMTKLTGDTGQNKEIYRHTGAHVYFTQRKPAGFNNPPPYNFQGKPVSCQVYLPQNWTGVNPRPSVNIFVKDATQRNDSGKPIPIDASTTGKWIQLSFVVGKYPEDADQGFDGTHIISIGVQVVVPLGSTLNYTGPFYIDNCILPH